METKVKKFEHVWDSRTKADRPQAGRAQPMMPLISHSSRGQTPPPPPHAIEQNDRRNGTENIIFP